MAQVEDIQTDDNPLDPAVERVRRKLVRFIVINLGILFLALMAVVGALVYRATRVETPPAPPTEFQVPAGGAAYGEIALPQGARIVSHALSGNRMSLQVDLTGGARSIFVYDMVEGRMVGRFDIKDAQ
jgi:uncharacterized SAM-binding protein YcdF (DUF218 family)